MLVDQIEQMAKAAPSAQVRVMILKNGSAPDIAKTLSELYKTADRNVAVSADARGNRLVVRCPMALAEEIATLVRELDVK